MDLEKQQLQELEAQTQEFIFSQKKSTTKPRKLIEHLIGFLVAGFVFVNLLQCFSDFQFNPQPLEPINTSELCPVSTKVIPTNFEKEIAPTLKYILNDESYRNATAERLGGAVRIPTEITEEWRDIDAPQFETFADLHKYFEKAFPTVHKSLKKETVNKYNLVYTWQGTDPSLKPILLMGHQDVVPVEWETADQWSYHPFSGYFDGETVWGRGASDCKNLVTGLLETVELLLKQDFQPKRTVILGFGYDEEAIGDLGALEIYKFLSSRYGDDSFYAAIDEGSAGLAKNDDIIVGTIGTGEKGYVDSHITLKTPGGHSSVPPDHTAIGIMSQFLNIVEQTPFEPTLSTKNPFLGNLQCIAAHSNVMDEELRRSILKAGYDKLANKFVVKYLTDNVLTRYYVKTSQAIDIINGGMKSNALPESVTALINTRISVDSSVKETVDKLMGNLKIVAEEYDLGIIYEGKEIKSIGETGYFNYTITAPLETAPVTPSTGPVWDIFTGTMKHVYEDFAYSEITKNGTEIPIIFAPGISTGNTDTKSFWNLTRNIYRHSPGQLNPMRTNLNFGIHSVNERASIESHLNIIAIYYEYLHNLNEYATSD